MNAISRLIAVFIMFNAMLAAARVIKKVDPITATRTVVAAVDLRQIAAALMRYEAIRESFPPQERFQIFMRQNFQLGRRRVARDPWGTPYGYKRTRDGARVYSCGPDKQPGTADDLYIELQLYPQAHVAEDATGSRDY